ncbi:hypothetical protein EKH55_3002 [Sinorhizobium alkalisoli]|nr:hypothetical protein EKH55_3002 [Sinorhizobium alkalisoli]
MPYVFANASARKSHPTFGKLDAQIERVATTVARLKDARRGNMHFV